MMTTKSKPEVIRPPALSKKVPKFGGPSSEDAVRNADRILQTIAGEFQDLLGEELQALDLLMLEYKQSPTDDVLDKLFRRIHNLRGQGTTMGFPLVTRIGTSFCRYLIERNSSRPVNVPLIQQHLQALNIVLKEKLANENDKVSQQVAAALEEAVQREMA